MHEAESKGNEYLARWAACRGALFACRLVLAHNRVLYPFHKWMLAATERLTDRPSEMMTALDELVRDASPAAVDRLVEMVLGYRDWAAPAGGRGPAFMRDTEQLWLRGEPAIEDI